MDIPVIDFKRLFDPAELGRLDQACRHFGFFFLANHGLDTLPVQQTARDFFALPLAGKRTLLRSQDNPYGYYDKELTKNRRDWKEIYDVGLDAESGQARWPGDWPVFRSTVEDWYQSCQLMSKTLLAAVAMGLGQERDRLDEYFLPSDTSFLRLNHYPVCPEPADGSLDQPTLGHLGISEHTDAGALTVLLQETPGLQFKSAGQWHDVLPRAGCLTINIGDMVQVWSNDQYTAPLHRVLAHTSRIRETMAFFYNPSFEAICLPLAAPARYRPISWRAFRQARASGDYADQGEEIQISHFLLEADA